MSSQNRITRAYKTARRISYNNDSKFIIFSDVHRGDNSFADDFANNKNTYYHALTNYFNNGFTYLELGDGDELWENRKFSSIYNAHLDVFKLLKKFFTEGRWIRLIGNHDMVYKNQKYVEKHLYTSFDPVTNKKEPLFPDISFSEGLILKHEETNQEIFMLHGHQADWMNYYGWKFYRFMVLLLWKRLQIFGIGDPTSPAKNNIELIKVERRTKKWIAANKNLFTIIGHTHRPRFPYPGETPFFNDGSCVHPRSISGLEIVNNEISLIKWRVSTSKDGTLKIIKKVIEGPKKIEDYNKPEQS